MKIDDGKIRIEFTHLGGGLVAKGYKLTGFAIAGADRKFVWADATIDGDTVVVSNPLVAAPASVRYAWADNPECDLYNKAGLPASPFRTDDWPQERTIAVGMALGEATDALAAAGAKETQLGMMPPGEGREMKCYELSDGRLVCLTTKKGAVAGISVCADADKPKAQRTWTKVQALTVHP